MATQHDVEVASRVLDRVAHETQDLTGVQLEQLISLLMAKRTEAAAMGPLETLACTVPFTVTHDASATVAPLIAQTPFRPDDLKRISFRAGERRAPLYMLSAEYQSRKTAAMAYLACKALDAGCWVLVLLNMDNNATLNELHDKLWGYFRSIGVTAGEVDIEKDDIFNRDQARRLEKKIERILCTAGTRSANRDIWVCKADESVLTSLVDRIPAEALSRCVVLMDEVHAFYRQDAQTTLDGSYSYKKAEIALNTLLLSRPDQATVETTASSSTTSEQPANLRVRAVVFADATDADVPHVLLYTFKSRLCDFVRIEADGDRIRSNGYSGTDAFENVPLDKALGRITRYGKDMRKRFDGAGRNVAFATDAQRDDMHPQLDAELAHALDQPIDVPASFFLELTTLERSDDTGNPVGIHARVVARLFPNADALADSGDGCVLVRADGTTQKFGEYDEAHKHLLAEAKAANRPMRSRYLITNRGFGSVTFSRPDLPITHIHIYVPKSAVLQTKAQGIGRACGYVAKDLRNRRVRVLCPKADFDAMVTGLKATADEAFAQYPNHGSGQYSTSTGRDHVIANVKNPHAARMRRTADFGSAGEPKAARRRGAKAPQQSQPLPSDVKRLPQKSVKDDTALRSATARPPRPGEGWRASPPSDGEDVREHWVAESHLRDLIGDHVQVTTRVVFLQPSAADAAAEVVEKEKAAYKRLRQLQNDACEKIVLAHIAPDAASHSAGRYNKKCNPAGGGQLRCIWAVDETDGVYTAVIRTVPKSALRVPFVCHELERDDNGIWVAVPVLVTDPATTQT